MATQYVNGHAGKYITQDIPDEFGFPTGNTKQVFVYDEPGHYELQDVPDEWGGYSGKREQAWIFDKPTAPRYSAPPLKADAQTISTLTPVMSNVAGNQDLSPTIEGYTGVFKDASGDNILGRYDSNGNLVSTMKQVGGTQYNYSPSDKLIGQENVGGSGGFFGGFKDLLTSDMVKTIAPMVLSGGLGGAAGVGNMLGTNALVGGAALGAGTAALTGGDILKGALTGGIGGASNLQIGDAGVSVGDISKAANIAKAVNNGDLLGAVTGAANLSGAGNTQIGDTGLTLGDLSKDIKLATAVINGNPQAVFSALTSVASDVAKSSADAAKATDPYFQTGAGTGALPSTDISDAGGLPSMNSDVMQHMLGEFTNSTDLSVNPSVQVASNDNASALAALEDAKTAAQIDSGQTVDLGTVIKNQEENQALSPGLNFPGDQSTPTEEQQKKSIDDLHNALTETQNTEPTTAVAPVENSALSVENTAETIPAPITGGLPSTDTAITENNLVLTDPYFQTGAGTGGLPPVEKPTESPATHPDEVKQLENAGLTNDYSVPANYNLFSDSTAAPSLEDMGGGQGIQVAPVNENQNVGYEPVDYGLNTSTPFEGLQMPTVPNDPSMGGGQGLTVPVTGGTMTGSGLIDSTYSPALGDPNSFINGGTGNLPGGSGNVTTPTTPSKPSTPSTPSTTPSAPTTSKTNPFGVLPLDSSAQMLTSTMPTGQTAKMAQLHQLFNSLTPEMRDVFLSKGISPSEPGMTTAATGGLISDETSKILDSLNPKYISVPTHLQSVAPQQQESRLGALRHIGQGPLKGQGLSNRMAQGGLPHKYVEAAPEGHKPEFITGLTGYYAQGGGTGQSDDIPAMLHDGDFVMDADTVASLGDGSSKAGAEVLEKMRKQVPHHDGAGGSPVPAKIADGEYVFPASFVTAIGGGSNKVGAERLNEMREKIRAHKRSAPTTKIPPKAKSPLDYLKMAKG